MFEWYGAVKINPIVNNPFKEIRGYIDGRRKFTVERDLAWALVHLMEAGMAGYTLDGGMAPLSSEEICKLRRMGMEIETVRSKVPGGQVGFRLRYVLRSAIAITEIQLTEKFRYIA
jgi:hypothetical protein